MPINIWKRCDGQAYIKNLEAKVWRLIEAQHISATRKLVDSAEEHAILEDLIEKAKPPVQYTDLHYLLYTPFRYPPLPHGSRFGKASQRSLWYGSLELEAALTEVAYHRFLFLLGSVAQFGIVETQFSAFAVDIKTSHGVDLTKPLFNQYEYLISSPKDYSGSQALGDAMRKNKVEAFFYKTARAKQGTNVGIFSPEVFYTKKPQASSYQTWHCVSSLMAVEFTRQNLIKVNRQIFLAEQFMVDGEFPVLE